MNLRKRIAAITTAALCSLSAFSFSMSKLDSENVYAAGVTGKTAFEITDQMTIGWNLGNSLDCSNTGSTYSSDPKIAVTRWGNPEPTQALFDAVKAAGFNTVRIPTTWYEHIRQDSSGFWEISPDWMAYVKKTVDYAYNNDMFVILNIHHEEWVNVPEFNDTTKAEASEKIEDIWSQIAEEFKDYDQRLVFEGMNEPRQTGDPSIEWGYGDTNSWKYINDLNAIFIDTVRSQGSDANKERVLSIPGYCAKESAQTVGAINIPEGSGNVAISVHAYIPYFFTMATDSYANHEYKADGTSASGYGSNYRSEINSTFNSLKSLMQQKNAPIILGEFSASDFGNTDSRINWAKDYLTAAENAGIPCVLWDNNAVYTEGSTPSGENHGYINRKTNTWYSQSAPVIEAMMQTVGVTDYSVPVYTAGEFAWSNMPLTSDMITIFESKEGTVTADEDGNPADWGNVEIKDYEDYLNDNYRFVVFADSAKAPAFTLMTSNIGVVDGMGWNSVPNDGKSTQDYVYYYTYEDMKTLVEGTGDQMGNITNAFISAQGTPATVYGVYAQPVDSNQPITTQPVVTTTNVTTTKTTITKTTTTKTTSNQDDSNKIEASVNAGADGYAFELSRNIGNELYVDLAASDAVTFANGCVGLSVTYNGVDYWVSYNWTISQSGTVKIDITKPDQISYNNGADVVDDILLTKAIVAEAYSKNSGLVQVWWANDGSGEGIATSNVEVNSVYIIDNPLETLPVFTTASPIVTTVTTTTTTTEAPTVNIGTPSKIGDVNCDGDIATADLIELAKYTVNAASYPLKNEVANANADINSDKKIDSLDVQKLVEYLLESIKSL